MNTVLAHWSASWPVLIAYLAVALAHLAGLRRLMAATAGGDRPGLLREAAMVHAGLLVAVTALVSPLAYWSATYLWVQAIQGVALSFVAPPLIVLGAPWPALRRAIRPAGPDPAAAADTWRARLPESASPAWRARLAESASPGGPAWRPWRPESASPAWPVVTAVLFNLTSLGWHLPVLSDLARGNGAAGAARTVTCLGTGILFWLQLLGSRPLRPAAASMRPAPAPLGRLALVIGTVIAGTALGMALVFGSSELYPAFAGPAHHVLTLLDDQQLAGAVLWMGMLPPLVIAAVALLLRWLSEEESEALSAGIEALLSRRQSAWPSRPGLR